MVDEDTDEVYPAQVSAVDRDDSQLVTLKLELGNYLQFQVDTGAQFIPLALFKDATKGIMLAHFTPLKSKVTSYGGTILAVVVRLRRGHLRYQLDCKLVDSSQIRPLLGGRACLGMKIVGSG